MKEVTYHKKTLRLIVGILFLFSFFLFLLPLIVAKLFFSDNHRYTTSHSGLFPTISNHLFINADAPSCGSSCSTDCSTGCSDSAGDSASDSGGACGGCCSSAP